jgi:hypothetical protein
VKKPDYRQRRLLRVCRERRGSARRYGRAAEKLEDPAPADVEHDVTSGRRLVQRLARALPV